MQRWLKAFFGYQKLLVLMLFISVDSNAELPIESYGLLPEIQKVAVSPSGNIFAFRRTTEKEDAIWVYSLQEQKSLGGVSLPEGLSPTKLTFVSDKHLVMLTKSRARLQGFNGGLRDVIDAYVFNIKNKKIKRLLDTGSDVYLGQRNLGRIIGASSDKKHVYMAAFKGDAAAYETPFYSVFKVKLDAPKRRKVAYIGDEHGKKFLLDAKGDPLIKEVYNNNNKLHQIFVIVDGKWKEIYQKETELRTVILEGLSPDYQSIIVSKYKDDRETYFTIDIATGEMAETDFSRKDADVERIIADVNGVIKGVRYSGFNPTYKFIDTKLHERIVNVQSMFPDNSVWLSSWTPDFRTLVVYVEGSQYSGRYFAFKEGEKPELLAIARPGVKKSDIHPIRTFSYTASDGRKIPSLLTIPKDKIDSIKNLPAIMLPHGGPKSYDRIGFDWMAQAFADKGYMVIQPQFRGSSGFGWDHHAAGHGEWGKKMQTDLNDGLQVLIKSGYVDAKRVCIVGASYGGYAALAAGAFSPEIYQCVVSINGISALNLFLKDRKKYFGKGHSVLAYWNKLIADNEGSREELDAISPANFARNYTSPVLLIHGEKDRIVEINQSKRMVSRFNSAKKDVEFIKVKNDDHYLRTNEGRLKALKATLDFVNQHLK